MTTPNQPQPDDQQPKRVLDATTDQVDTSEKLVLASPDAADSPRDFSLWAGVLFLLALTIYSPAMRGEFLWDDDAHVTKNATLRSVDGLRQIWTEMGATPQYYPLTHTSYWIEYQLFGKGAGAATLDPLVFHITNILLHALGATLLWFILRRLRVPGAWLAAAVFAVHPVNVESVAWISERKNVLSGAFFFGSILAYLRFEAIGLDGLRVRPRDNWNVYALSLVLFVCALLSKTVVCSMPAVVLLLLWWKRGRLRLADVLPLVPYFVIGIAMAALTSNMERHHVIGEHYAIGDWSVTPVQRVLIAGRAVWFYLMKLVLPLELTFTYPRWNVNPADALPVAAGDRRARGDGRAVRRAQAHRPCAARRMADLRWRARAGAGILRRVPDAVLVCGRPLPVPCQRRDDRADRRRGGAGVPPVESPSRRRRRAVTHALRRDGGRAARAGRARVVPELRLRRRSDAVA
jgi:hypothetical protein